MAVEEESVVSGHILESCLCVARAGASWKARWAQSHKGSQTLKQALSSDSAPSALPLYSSPFTSMNVTKSPQLPLVASSHPPDFSMGLSRMGFSLIWVSIQWISKFHLYLRSPLQSLNQQIWTPRAKATPFLSKFRLFFSRPLASDLWACDWSPLLPRADPGKLKSLNTKLGPLSLDDTQVLWTVYA
jgi:hypothetical protein